MPAQSPDTNNQAADDPHADVIGALTLLLADLSDDDRVRVLQRAAPDLMIAGDAPMGPLMRDIAYTADQALGICDGSSGLGALAAKNLNSILRIQKTNAARMDAIFRARSNNRTQT